MTSHSLFSIQTAAIVVNIINNLAQVDAQELESAQTEDGAASRVTQALENILLNLEVSKNLSFRAVTSNVAAQVRYHFYLSVYLYIYNIYFFFTDACIIISYLPRDCRPNIQFYQSLHCKYKYIRNQGQHYN